MHDGPRRARSVACLLGAAAVAALLAASGSASAKPGGTVTIRLPGDFDQFNFTKGQLLPASIVQGTGYDHLLSYRPSRPGGTPTFTGYLAERWRVAPHDLTFVLRKGPVCPSGAPLTATMVKRSLDLFTATAPNLASTWGPGPYTITANDRTRTVRVHSAKANNELIYWVGGSANVVCPPALDDPARLSTGVYGSGAYQLASATHGSSVIMKLNSKWAWGPNGVSAKTPGIPSRVVYRVVPNETTAANLLLSGALDAGSVAGPDVTRVLNSKKFQASVSHNYLVYEAEFNGRTGRPTTDSALRRAITMVIDENAWNKVVNQGRGITSATIVTKDSNCYDAGATKLRSRGTLDQAKSLLRSVGYKPAGGTLVAPNGKALHLSVIGLDAMGSGPEYIASQIRKLGIDASSKAVPTTEWTATAFAGNFDVWINTLFGPWPTPGSGAGFITGPAYPKGYNSDGFVDEQQDAMFAAAKAAGSQKSACRHWSDFQRNILKKHYMVPLAAPYQYNFVRKGITFQTWGPASAQSVLPMAMRLP
jgi:peptide/nickel transport system substrate-binding protein